MSNDKKYELILCIVNAGFSDVVMDAARECGARGGTVIHGRGTANKQAEEFFHITIQPDKEILMILVEATIKDDVLHAVYRAAGLKTEGQGIVFSMPVNHVAGLSAGAPLPKKKEEAQQKQENEQPEATAEEKPKEEQPK